MNYKADPKSATITALNILDGLALETHFDTLQQAWEAQGGFIEFCGWIAHIAEFSEKELEKRKPQDFPGIYDYEVSFEVGVLIRAYMLASEELPPDEVWKDWIVSKSNEFFAQGGG